MVICPPIWNCFAEYRVVIVQLVTPSMFMQSQGIDPLQESNLISLNAAFTGCFERELEAKILFFGDVKGIV